MLAYLILHFLHLFVFIIRCFLFGVGEPFINGPAVPYDPKYHEYWARNNPLDNHEEWERNNSRDNESDNESGRET
ncbi:hypothetical protein Sjap_000465 [Stephania japonica]|uniref:Uncharacterized protein n=1 Tax=Stephania japonica TaxID=461633 RepID=A0AAP0KKN8_9MAGN